MILWNKCLWPCGELRRRDWRHWAPWNMAECVLLMVRSVKVQRVFLSHGALIWIILTVLAVSAVSSTNNLCDGVKCVHGTCQNVTESRWICVCNQGWGGSSCDSCLGRVKWVVVNVDYTNISNYVSHCCLFTHRHMHDYFSQVLRIFVGFPHSWTSLTRGRSV